MEVKDWVNIVTGMAALLGFSFGLYTYWRNQMLKRAEWLEKLHSKFFESEKYSRIRQILDHKIMPEYGTLQHDNNPDLAGQFVDYLNFFEFIASLWQMKQLTRIEILRLFEYYLKQLKSRDFERRYIRKYGFENLEKLLVTFREQG